MNERLKQAQEYYSLTAKEGSSAAERTGRPNTPAHAEEAMWRDMLTKLMIVEGNSVVDIGVGNGLVAREWLKFSQTHTIDITLADFPEVIDALLAAASSSFAAAPRVSVARGAFPQSFEPDILSKRFDRIVINGVINYTDDPAGFIEAAVRLLRAGGRLLIGDLPNISKKGRFLASCSGRRFDAEYKSVPLETAPLYGTHHDFVASFAQPGTNWVTDDLIIDVMRRYRHQGYDVYVLEQPLGLPFCYTREDLLICAPRP